MRPGTLLAALCLVTAVTPAIAASPIVSNAANVSNSAASSNVEPASSSLEKALDAISADKIRADITYIASDELEGRDTPSEGQRVAARFIRARLERLGFKPGAPEGYLYEYPLYLPRLRADGSQALVTRGGESATLELGRDYFIRARDLATVELDAGVVFCGNGRKGDAHKDVRGKWAMVFDDGKTFGDIERALTAAGAIGVLMTPGSDYDDKPYAERFGSETRRLTGGQVRWPSASQAEAPWPVVWIDSAAAERMAPEMFERGRKPRPGLELKSTFKLRLTLEGENGIVQCENVCGFWPGSDPALKDEVIVVSAHYDHVGYGPRGDAIHNGADDNGSGTTGLMALAEGLVAHGPMRRSVMLIWVSGEEKGLYGSKAWTEKPWLPGEAKPVCNINIDMVGRNKSDELMITPTRKHDQYNGLVKLAEKLCDKEGFPKLGSCDAYWGRSDHANFAQNLKIPVTFLFSGEHEDYHQPGDDPEKIDYDKVRRVARLVLRMLDGLQEDKLKL